MTDLSSEVSIEKEELVSSIDHEETSVEDIQENCENSEIGAEESRGIVHSLKEILSVENYNVLLVTSWILGSVAYVQAYFNLYLRALGWSFINMGIMLSGLAFYASFMRLLGGHVGDTVNRKNLSVGAFLLISIFYFILGIFTEPLMLVVGLVVYYSHTIARSGSSAYILENTPKKHSGLAMSLFNVGKVFGIITLVVFGALIPMIGFIDAFRAISLSGSVLLFLSSLARSKYLIYKESNATTEESPWGLKRFLIDNKRAIQKLLTLAPGLLTIIIMDAISDSFFKFGALIYANEVLAIDVSGINLILLAYSILSVPLLLKVGRISDKKGTRKAALIVYALMPVSAALLLVGPFMIYWGPTLWVETANSVYPGLGVLFSTAFIAIVLKYLNDVLWYMVLLTLIQKSLPKEDTSKILSIFWFTVYICSSIGPLLAGFIFAYLSPMALFALVLGLNIILLLSIKVGSFGKTEPVP